MPVWEVDDSQPAHNGTFCNLSQLFFLQSNHIKSEKLIYLASYISRFDGVTFKTGSALSLAKQGGSSCICGCTVRLCDLGICGRSRDWITASASTSWITILRFSRNCPNKNVQSCYFLLIYLVVNMYCYSLHFCTWRFLIQEYGNKISSVQNYSE